MIYGSLIYIGEICIMIELRAYLGAVGESVEHGSRVREIVGVEPMVESNQ